MAVIQRPSKQGGVTTYQAKVSAGYTKILASEMDADLDTIFSAWNTGVDTVNIRPGSITGDKLAPGAIGTRELADLGVATADLADGAVTTLKIADLGVTSAKLADGAVTSAKLASPITLPSITGNLTITGVYNVAGYLSNSVANVSLSGGQAQRGLAPITANVASRSPVLQIVLLGAYGGAFATGPGSILFEVHHNSASVATRTVNFGSGLNPGPVAVLYPYIYSAATGTHTWTADIVSNAAAVGATFASVDMTVLLLYSS
jgi:hypothetical protein